MTELFDTEKNCCSATLAENLREVAADLRAIDLADLVGYIRFGAYTTLEDLVQSSTELFFKPGTLSFAWTATVELGWDEPPSITLGMEFRHALVTLFFDLTLRATAETVTVCGILFDEPVEEARKSELLGRAITGARLKAAPALEAGAPRRPEDEIR